MADQVLTRRDLLGDPRLNQVGADQVRTRWDVSGIPVEHRDPMAGVEEGGGDMRADKSAAAGDEDPHGRIGPSGYGPDGAGTAPSWPIAGRPVPSNRGRLAGRERQPVWEQRMTDVILPVLDERQALPGVLASIPAGYRAIVVDNGSTDGSGQLRRPRCHGGHRAPAGFRRRLLGRPDRGRLRDRLLHGL